MAKVRDGMDFYINLRKRLLCREASPNSYLTTLEGVLGRSTDCAIISTAEHVGFFNRRGNITFALPQLCLSAAARDPVDLLFLTTAAIPLSNRAYPKGILLPSKDGGERVNLFTNSDKARSPLFLEPVHHFDNVAFRRMPPAGHQLLTSLLRNATKRSYAEQLAACMKEMLTQWLTCPPVGEISVHVSETIEVAMLAALLRRGDAVIQALLFSRELRREFACLLTDTGKAKEDVSLPVLLRYNCNGTLEPLVERVPGAWEAKDYMCDANPELVLRDIVSGKLWPSPILSVILLSYLPNLPINGGPNQSIYYAQTLNAMNRLFGLNRSSSLNVHGYYCQEFDYDVVSLWPDGGLLPACGTGLALCWHPISPEWALHQYRNYACQGGIESASL